MRTPTVGSVYDSRRDQIIEIYRPVLGRMIGHTIAVLPRHREDLRQIANLALVEVANSFEGYLCKRVRGAVLDAGRKIRHDAKCLRIDEFPEFSADVLPIEELLDEASRVGHVCAAIASLPAAERKVITLKVRGDTTPQIAAKTGVSKRTVIRRNVGAVSAIRLAVAA